MKLILYYFTLLTLWNSDVLGQGIDSAWMEKYTSKFSSNIGEELSDLPLSDINGKVVSLKQFKNRTMYVNIWSTSCAPCLALYPKEEVLMKDIEKMGLSDSVLFVNICTELASERSTWKTIISTRKDNAVNLFCPDSVVFNKWNMKIIWPTFVLVDNNGRSLGKKVPSPENAGVAFMLLAATKGISAKDSYWIRFRNDKLLRQGSKDIDSTYLNYLSKYHSNHLPYIIWQRKQ